MKPGSKVVERGFFHQVHFQRRSTQLLFHRIQSDNLQSRNLCGPGLSPVVFRPSFLLLSARCSDLHLVEGWYRSCTGFSLGTHHPMARMAVDFHHPIDIDRLSISTISLWIYWLGFFLLPVCLLSLWLYPYRRWSLPGRDP